MLIKALNNISNVLSVAYRWHKKIALSLFYRQFLADNGMVISDLSTK